MKNILSYQDKRFTGAEIKEWIKHHLDNHTEYYKMAKSMRGYLNTIHDDRTYLLSLRKKTFACGGEVRYQPQLYLYYDYSMYIEDFKKSEVEYYDR